MATITGTNNIDILIGTSGADIIDGLKDKDAMYGGLGNDVYFVENTGDKIYENAGEGIDTVKSTVTYVLADEVENLTLLGTAGIDAWGNAKNNVLTGNDGDNWLVGGAGNDTMSGGKGSDTYFVDSIGDKVIESVTNANGGGVDTVVSSISFSLAGLANVENLELSGTYTNGTGNALNNTITGTMFNNVIDGGKGADTMSGGDGHDNYYVDNVGDVVKENKNEGIDWVISSIALSGPFANVENYQFNVSTGIQFSGNGLDNYIIGGSGKDTIDGGGTGQDSLSGRGGDDSLSGGAGMDTLDGGTGADIMKGFGSDDVYVVDNVKDQVVEQTKDGSDTVMTYISLAKLYDNVEDVYLLGSSSINATGNDLGNTIHGNVGNNVIDGGKGIDTMTGGNGNDTYVVDQMLDIVDETSSTGIDLVKSSISYTLGTNLENLTLTGTGDINGTGNGDKNSIIGNAGSNILDGKGGDDTMTGGAGDDIYVVDTKGDKVVEAANGGSDTIFSSIDYSLNTLANIEILSITGSAVHATGNAKDNIVYGNDGKNDIDGGTGADILHGGKGDDTYHVDNILDFVDEDSGQGFDTVISKVALDLGAVNVENYIFQTSQAVHFMVNIDSGSASGGSGDDVLNASTVGGSHTLLGNAGNDELRGGADADFLDGGTGTDQMLGGKGDDVYIVDNAKDVVTEQSGWGTDEVDTSISIANLFDNVETLGLMGTANLDGGGNQLANMIYGNSGNNQLFGRDGDDLLIGNGGNDTMTGGSGADEYQFNVSQPGQGHDTVTDFVKTEDVLWFTGVADANNDSKFDLNDLLSSVSAIVDHGAGQAVDVAFNNGATVSFAGCGTGAVNSLDDLVANSATQIQIN